MSLYKDTEGAKRQNNHHYSPAFVVAVTGMGYGFKACDQVILSMGYGFQPEQLLDLCTVRFV